MSVELQQFYRGKHVAGGREQSDFIITANSAGINAQQIRGLFGQAHFGSYTNPRSLRGLKHGYGLLRADNATYFLLHVRLGPILSRDYFYPDYRVIVIPYDLIWQFGGNWQVLHDLLDDNPHLPEISTKMELPTVTADIAPLSQEQEIKYLQFLHDENIKAEVVEQILTALLSQKSVAITNAPVDPQWRWQLVQALALTLPAIYRHEVTFATETFESNGCPARIKLLYQDENVRAGANDLTLDWSKQSYRPSLSPHPYAQFVATNWAKGATWLVETVRSPQVVERINLLISQPPDTVLTVLSDKLTLSQKIETGKVTLAEWPQVERLLKAELELAPQAPGLKDGLQKNIRSLAQHGFGDQLFRLLQPWLPVWKTILVEITLLRLEQFEDETALLGFIQTVQSSVRSNTERWNEVNIWPEFIERLQRIMPQSEPVSRHLLNLAWDYGLVDEQLLLAKPARSWPTPLQPVMSHLSNPQRKITSSQASLLEASRVVSAAHQTSFFWLLLQLAQKRNCPQLVDFQVVQHLKSLAGRQQKEVKATVNWLAGQLESLPADTNFLLELADLYLTLNEFKQAGKIWHHVARHPMTQSHPMTLAQHLNQIAQQTTDPARLWEMLQDKPFEPTIMRTIQLGLLNNHHWRNDHHLNQIFKQLHNQAWQQPTWSDRMAQFNQLLDCLAIRQRNQLRDTILDKIYQYARDEASPEELKEMRRQSRRYQQWSNETGLDALDMLADALGSQRVTEFQPGLTQSVNFLAKLKHARLDWRVCEPELVNQFNRLRPEELGQFRQDCLELAAMLDGSSAPNQTRTQVTPQMAVGALQKLIGALQTVPQQTHTWDGTPQPPAPQYPIDQQEPDWMMNLVIVFAVVLLTALIEMIGARFEFFQTFFTFSAVITLLALFGIIGKSIFDLINFPPRNLSSPSVAQLGLSVFLLITTGIVWLVGSGGNVAPGLISLLGLLGLIYFVAKPFLSVPKKYQSWLNVSVLGVGLLFTVCSGVAVVGAKALSGGTDETANQTPTAQAQANPTVQPTNTPNPTVHPTDTPMITETPTSMPEIGPTDSTDDSGTSAGQIEPLETTSEGGGGETTDPSESVPSTPMPEATINAPLQATPSEDTGQDSTVDNSTNVITLQSGQVIYADMNTTQPLLTIESQQTATLINEEQTTAGWQRIELQGEVWVASQLQNELLANKDTLNSQIRIVGEPYARSQPGATGETTIIGTLSPGTFPYINEQEVNGIIWYQIRVEGYVQN